MLEFVAKTPEQQRFYDSQLKFQRDEAARNTFARKEALREGREEDVLLGRIATFEELLGIK